MLLFGLQIKVPYNWWRSVNIRVKQCNTENKTGHDPKKKNPNDDVIHLVSLPLNFVQSTCLDRPTVGLLTAHNSNHSVEVQKMDWAIKALFQITSIIPLTIEFLLSNCLVIQ